MSIELLDYIGGPFIFGVLLFCLALILFESFRYFVNRFFYGDILITVVSILLIASIDYASLLLMTSIGWLTFYFATDRMIARPRLFLVPFFVLVSLVAIKLIIRVSDSPFAFVGVSYYYFRLGAFAIERVRGNPAYKNVSARDFFVWLYFFPLFLSGPIQRFHLFERDVTIKLNVTTVYLTIFFWIFVKVVVLDAVILNTVLLALRKMMAGGAEDLNGFYGIIVFCAHGFTSFLYGYLDFMAYMKIAMALGVMFGYKIIPNFNAPLLATNLVQFWRRWHISLSDWARDYVHFPLMIKYKSVNLATLATMLTIGLWHGVNINWIIWAVLHSAALIVYYYFKLSFIYKLGVENRISRGCMALGGWVVTMLFVGTVYNLVAIPSDYSAVWSVIDVLF